MKRYFLLLFFMLITCVSFAQVGFMGMKLGIPLDEMTERLQNKEGFVVESKDDYKVVLRGDFGSIKSCKLTIERAKKEGYGDGVYSAVFEFGDFYACADSFLRFSKIFTEQYGECQRRNGYRSQFLEWTLDDGEICLFKANDKAFLQFLLSPHK